MRQFFVNTGDSVDFYDTREEAILAAQLAIDGWRDCCDPHWPEEAAAVCWGEVLGHSAARSIPDGDAPGGEYIEYELTESATEYRCNLCGGLVQFDGTKPGVPA